MYIHLNIECKQKWDKQMFVLFYTCSIHSSLVVQTKKQHNFPGVGFQFKQYCTLAHHIMYTVTYHAGAWQVTMVMYDIVTVVFVYVACYNNNGWLSSWTVCCTILLVFVHKKNKQVCVYIQPLYLHVQESFRF